ncbi:MAG: oligosaccharide flippase family protein [Bacteroidota bacterium]|nr:oligosaccharide flippase family protein [Bacteroidota bacterium]MDP4212408.1 oligosaccharide flippase family protein [Bacteroidota bacterium]MDP4251268.1 oligosaccharide flippase family protein [Bacteroidota bacterium]
MSTIRRQSILSSGIIYIGFALGFLNTYLFTREGGFTPDQYGLTGIFIAIANVFNAFANLGMQAYIYKFYPYYHDNLQVRDNDMITWALLTSLLGFLMVMGAGYIFEDLVIRKFGEHSAELITYYSWIFPFGFGLTIYSLLEAYAWQLKKSVLTTFLREMLFRLFTTILIILVFTRVIRDFNLFIKLYALTYILLALTLLFILIRTRQIHFTFRISRVTRKFHKKIVVLSSFIWSGGLIYNISIVFDTIVIAAVMPNGLAFAGIFTLAQNVASLIQAPQRGIIAASVGPLSRAWKDKDYEKIKRIYQRSSINQLLFACGIFVLIWLNFTDGVKTFHLQRNYLQAQQVFIFLGLIRIVDMGTGVNSQIIGTSTFWRFEFFTGMILLAITLPLNYVLTKKMGVVGPAIATLIALTIYNTIRYFFLLRKFNMQPFNIRTLFTLVLALSGYYATHLLLEDVHGLTGLILRTLMFIGIYASGALLLKLSPDIIPVWNTLKKKMTIPYLRSRK